MRFLASLAPLAVLATSVAGSLLPRGSGQQATAMMAVPADCNAVPKAEFDDWYENDHFVRIFRLPGFLSNSRFEATDGIQPDQTTMYDLATIDAIHSAEWDWFDKNRPQLELDIISKCNHSDLLNLVLDGPVVGTVKGPSVLAFIQFTPAEGKEAEVAANYNKFFIPYLKSIKGFQRVRKYKLESFRYFKWTNRPDPPAFVAAVEYKINSGAFKSSTWKRLEKELLKSKALSAATVRYYKTSGTFGNIPWTD